VCTGRCGDGGGGGGGAGGGGGFKTHNPRAHALSATAAARSGVRYAANIACIVA